MSLRFPLPTEPEVFLKSMLSATGPFDPIRRGPNPGVKLDWEVELAIVIGREAQDIKTEEAADYILGYVVSTTSRTAQLKSTQRISIISCVRNRGLRTVRRSLPHNGH